VTEHEIGAQRAFSRNDVITSANFTEAAHEHNIELGVLFRDNLRVARSIRAKFESLIQNGFLLPLPGC